MLKITGVESLQKRITSIAQTIQKAATLEAFTKSPELPGILGRCVQRTIDAQKFKPLSAKYRVARDKKFGKKPILRLTDSLYKRAILPGFFSINPTSQFRIVSITISDLIGRYQQNLGRDIFKPDNQLRDELFILAEKTIVQGIKKG